MNMLFIIYIFALFVITSPNVFFNLNGKNDLISTIIHAAIFVFTIYLTKDIVFDYREEMVIGTMIKNGVESDVVVPDGLDLSGLISPRVEPIEEEEIVINNTVLDYGDYNNPKGEYYPLPGPLPSIYDDETEGFEGFKIDLDGINSIKKMFSEFKNDEPIKIKINNRIEEPIVKTIRHAVGPELLPEETEAVISEESEILSQLPGMNQSPGMNQLLGLAPGINELPGINLLPGMNQSPRMNESPGQCAIFF